MFGLLIRGCELKFVLFKRGIDGLILVINRSVFVCIGSMKFMSFVIAKHDVSLFNLLEIILE